jgi:hypothetical protein
MRRTTHRLVGVVIAAGLLAFPSAGAVASGLPSVANRPRITQRPPGHGGGGGASFGWASSNWSGYAVTGGPYTAATGSWTVPTVNATPGSTYSSSWVGIDGFNNNNLIQTGTEQDYYAGAAHYYAWWEILPAAETVITTMPVAAGDHLSASISKNVDGSWTISITDANDALTFTTVQTYRGPGASAEWIEEAPTVGGHIASLAHYGSSVFDNGTVNGAFPALVTADGGVMIQPRGQVSTPSTPDTADPSPDGFNVAYGAVSPPAPSS